MNIIIRLKQWLIGGVQDICKAGTVLVLFEEVRIYRRCSVMDSH